MISQTSFFTVPIQHPNQGEATYVLFSTHCTRWFIANQSSLEIIQSIVQTGTPEQAALQIAQKYGISLEIAQQDTQNVWHQVQQSGFLISQTSSPQKIILDTLFIHITNACNLHCPHCYAGSSAQNREFLPLSLLRKLFEEMQDLQGKKITITGGEPLLHPEIQGILTSAQAVARTQMLTNGSLISEPIADFLAKNNIGIQISLDGSTATAHDALRGHGSFAKVASAIEQLKTAGHQKRISLCTTVHQATLQDLPNIVDLAQAWNVPLLRFLPIMKLGRSHSNWNTLDIPLEEQYPNPLIAHIQNSMPKMRFEYGISGLTFESREGAEIWCPIGTMIVVAANGDAYPCPMMMMSPWKLGNVHEHSLKELLTSRKMAEIIKIIEERPKKIEECVTCDWRTLCQSGCLASSLNQYGTPWTQDCFCSYRKQFYPNMFSKLITF